MSLLRTCLECGSNKTSIMRGKTQHWYHYKDGYICNKCYHKLITNPKWNPITNKKWNPINNPKNNPRHMLFKGKSILLKSNPRKGICKNCERKIGDEYINSKGERARIKRTNIHHVKYNDDDPLRDTIELCASCHVKESWRLRIK